MSYGPLEELDGLILWWPTTHYVYTQPFAANPQNYRKYNLPAHEGTDHRAPHGSKIFACHDGEVYSVRSDKDGNAYGVHVRIRGEHNGEVIKTVYAHLQKALVKEGQQVKAGDVIGYADSTGNSTGSHLHLTLKLEGATARGLTDYPSDIVDPTPYLVMRRPPQPYPEDGRIEYMDRNVWNPLKE